MTVRRGAAYSYQVKAKTRKGDVKAQLHAGPESMQVSPAGLVTWRVPGDFPDSSADVILALRSASGQETFQSFTIRLID